MLVRNQTIEQEPLLFFSRYIMNKATITNLLASERTYIGIYLGAFLGACAMSSAFTAMPFVIKYFEGSDTAAGAAVSIFHLSYLFVCILAAMFVDRLRPKISVIASLLLQGSICLLIWLTVQLNGFAGYDPIRVIIYLSGLWGLALSFLWPPLMGWLSIGYEGIDLNRKLGIYNTSWSSGATIGPLIGGYLTSIDIKLSIAFSAAMLFFAAVMISFCRKPHTQRRPTFPVIDGDVTVLSLPRFRVAARVTLFLGFICLGLCRAPLGMLMKYELAFTEAHFGTALSIIALISTLSFFVLGKFHVWHYKKSPAFVAHTGLIVAMLMIIYSDRLATLYFAACLIGVSTAFFYTSHMFYGVSATQKRSGAMAVHEILLSAGIGIGAYVGGYLNDEFGRRYAPYMFGLAVIALGVTMQILLNFRIKTHSGSSPTLKTKHPP